MNDISIHLPNHTTIETIANAMGILLGCPQKLVCVGSKINRKILGITILLQPDCLSGQIVFDRAFVNNWPHTELSVAWRELGGHFNAKIPKNGVWLAMGSKLIEVFGGTMYYDAANPMAGFETCTLAFDAESFGCFEPWAYFEIAIKQLRPITDIDIEIASQLAEASAGNQSLPR